MRTLICCLGLLLAVACAQAGSVEARLIHASKDGVEVDETIKELVPKLKKIFGYDHYHQFGKAKHEIKEKEVIDLNIGEGFTVFVHPKGVEEKTHEMDVEIYSGRALLVKQTLKLRENHFVFIKGPEVGSDWIIVALRVVE